MVYLAYFIGCFIQLVGGQTDDVGCGAVGASGGGSGAGGTGGTGRSGGGIPDTMAPSPCTTATLCCLNLNIGGSLAAADQITLQAGPNTDVGLNCAAVSVFC